MCELWRTDLCKGGASGAEIQVSISELALPTYAQENISVTAGMPTTITVNGRLDLFASEVLEKAWLTVPLPRRVIFHVGREISSAGMQKLLGLCKEENSAAVIVSWFSQAGNFPPGFPVYNDTRAAIAALGDLPQSGPWLLDIQQ
ncbi:MAG TPA: hypothetical protein VEW46_15065 [Pyrinomonadaceae bacterium]|nr:hypothetical protein [Pyrinomonadaceae bacterium]